MHLKRFLMHSATYFRNKNIPLALPFSTYMRLKVKNLEKKSLKIHVFQGSKNWILYHILGRHVATFAHRESQREGAPDPPCI